MRRVLIAPIVLFLAMGQATLGGPAPVLAAPTEVHVRAYDMGGFDLFSPATVDVRRGGTVTWDFDGPSTHTATDGTGMELYDSGLVAGGGPSFSFAFTAAGRYQVVCTLHEDMGGTVEVPIGARPRSSPVGEAVVIRWGAGASAAGSVYDVQVRKPGRAWTMWQRGTDVTAQAFVPGRDGTFGFRARLRAPAKQAHAAWSAPVTVTVT